MQKLINHQYVDDIFAEEAVNDRFQMDIYSQVDYKEIYPDITMSSKAISYEYLMRIITTEDINCFSIQKKLIEIVNEKILEIDEMRMMFYALHGCEIQVVQDIKIVQGIAHSWIKFIKFNFYCSSLIAL